jgi:L-ascorbate metabolism protein UlaG (beta-lactamase superfamily)
LAGLGNKRFLERKGVYGAVELDWWESFRVNDRITITSVPARHFSGRGLFDRNKSLWCGFVISNAKDNIYYSGDTAYDSFTREIGNRFDPLVLSILPIGAFKPEWFMKYVHASPDEAVQMHLDLGSHKSIATHFGTFPMAWEGMDEPVKRLREVLAERKLPVDDFIIPEAGKTYTIQ